MPDIYTVHEIVYAYHADGKGFIVTTYRHGHTDSEFDAKRWLTVRAGQFVRGEQGETVEPNWGNNGIFVNQPDGKVRLFLWYEKSLPLIF